MIIFPRYKKVTMSKIAKSLIENKDVYIPECKGDSRFDLVYIVKKDENNPDLKMSLRSVDKFCTFRKIWIVGYKPSWVQNVEYIPTDQPGNKWNNSCINWKTACENKNISEDFVLMNDDFFALHPIRDWKSSLNVCLGSFDDEARKYKHTKFSKWQGGFVFGTELLDSLKCSTRYNFESHIPMVINKKNYLNMLKLPEIQEYMKTNKVLHKRTMYKNLYPDFEYSLPKKIRDVKVRLNCDLLSLWLEEDWLSVFDNVVGNVSSYPKLNIFLDSMFPNKCRFEI